jgi:hypothetical protein
MTEKLTPVEGLEKDADLAMQAGRWPFQQESPRRKSTGGEWHMDWVAAQSIAEDAELSRHARRLREEGATYAYVEQELGITVAAAYRAVNGGAGAVHT